MNVNLCVVARHDSAVDRTQYRFEKAIEYLQGVFGTAHDHVSRRGRAWAYNADRMSQTWAVPTRFEVDGVLYGVSQPPVPSDVETTAQGLPALVHDRVWGSKTPRTFLMNHWGYAVGKDGSVRVWTDLVGFARCYWVQTPDVIAVSNHIGALAHFLDAPVEIDDNAVGMFTNFGWFTAMSSPFKNIRRVPRATFLDITTDGRVREKTYYSLQAMTGERGAEPDFEEVVRSSRTAAHNLDLLSVRTPTVYLSGGQDSRMTAGLWLSGGSSANVMTTGTLEREAEIAQELMRLYASPRDLERQNVVHRITYPRPSEITMSLEQRLSTAHAMWDGDAAPTNMKRNLNVPSGSAALSIGGTNGEITHGYFYSKPGMVQRISGLEHPLKRMLSVFPGRACTPLVVDQLESFFEREYQDISAAGSPGLVSTDVFYLREKLRRWHNQSLNNTSAVLLGSDAYIRMAFDLSIEDKIQKRAPKAIASSAVPSWADVPYYKAILSESKVATSQGLRTWLTDPEMFNEVLDAPRIWDRYLRKDVMHDYRDLITRGEALGSHESWCNRAIWVDSLDVHREHINRRIAESGCRS